MRPRLPTGPWRRLQSDVVRRYAWHFTTSSLQPSGPRRGVQTDGGARPEMGTESASEGCGAPPPLRARAAGKNAAFELLEADFKAL